MPGKRFRFGVFEFDPAAFELRRNGTSVRLQSQPAQVLAALLANAGEVVTRNSLRLAVWGSDTHVDFESGLNFCITQLRSALGDSAESPLYIKTVPKRGYQFIAPVTVTGDTVEAPAVTPARLSWRRPVLGLLIAGAVSGWYGWWRLAKEPTRIAITRFENQSGDTALDRVADGLSDAVVAEFTTASPSGFEIIGNAPILRVGRDRQSLSRIAEDLNANYVVLGQVQRGPTSARVLIHLIRLPSQTHLWVTRVENPDLGDAVTAQRDIARRTVQEFLAKMRR